MAGDNAILKGLIIRELGKFQQSRSRHSDGIEHWEKDAELIELETEYKKLKKQKQELEEKIDEATLVKKLQEVLKNIEEADEPENVPLGELANNDLLFKAIELTKKKKLTELYKAYRLTGVACVLLKNNGLRFCLDTCYKGTYFEPYYIELHMENEIIQISKHSIPFFIPVDEIAQKYTGYKGLKNFVSTMSLYLNSFIARREQFSAAQVANEHYVIKDFYSTAASDFTKFTLQIAADSTQSFVVKMKYTNLKDKLPKEVDVNRTSQTSDDNLKNNIQECLLSMDVKKAILTAVQKE